MEAEAVKENGKEMYLDSERGVVVKGKTLFTWDTVPHCTTLKCTVYEKCNAVKRGRCGVQVKYLETLCATISATYPYLDDMMLFKIGTELIPLYSYLCRFQLVEKGLEDVTYVTKKGIISVHPIYRQIIDCMRAIGAGWKDLELGCIRMKLPLEVEKGDTERGDPHYYARISSLDKSSPTTRRAIR